MYTGSFMLLSSCGRQLVRMLKFLPMVRQLFCTGGMCFVLSDSRFHRPLGLIRARSSHCQVFVQLVISTPGTLTRLGILLLFARFRVTLFGFLFG